MATALSPQQKEWLRALGPLVEASEARFDQVGSARGELPQATVTISNQTESDLRLLRSDLVVGTARFVPGPPARIPQKSIATFRVVESKLGAGATAGSLEYHVERRRPDVDVTFRWALRDATITSRGELPGTARTRVETDPDTGILYEFFLVSSTVNEGEVRIGIRNGAGVPMTLLSATLQDPEHSEFVGRPKARLEPETFSNFGVQAADDEHPDAAGDVVYRIDQPGDPHEVLMGWRRGAAPTGFVNPDDGLFTLRSSARGDDRFSFEIVRNAVPPVLPGPTRVTVINDATFTMRLNGVVLDRPTDRLKSSPAQTIEGGGSTRFEAESTDPLFPQANGTMVYLFRPDQGASDAEHQIAMTWRRPSPVATIEAPAENVAVEASGTDKDVTFRVTGRKLDFNLPAETRQPTLRRGDKSVDGWVEYLQKALNHHIGAGLKIDGDFGARTHAAVFAFQTRHQGEGVQVDGIVGNQTWSFLREGVPEAPGTDGLRPHEFVERGLEARWVREKNVVRFDPARDALVMEAISVGDVVQIQDRPVRIRVTNPQAVQKVLERPIGPATSADAQGNTHEVTVGRFSTLFDAAAVGGPPPGTYTVEAFFDDELGGDSFSEPIVVAASA